jgi:hypothetical protein
MHLPGDSDVFGLRHHNHEVFLPLPNLEDLTLNKYQKRATSFQSLRPGVSKLLIKCSYKMAVMALNYIKLFMKYVLLLKNVSTSLRSFSGQYFFFA